MEEYFDLSEYADEDVDMPVAMVTCYGKAKQLSKETRDTLPLKCIMEYFRGCVQQMKYLQGNGIKPCKVPV